MERVWEYQIFLITSDGGSKLSNKSERSTEPEVPNQKCSDQRLRGMLIVSASGCGGGGGEKIQFRLSSLC